MSSPEAPRPWYHEGLAFTCTRCGDCCTGAPGYVWINTEELAALAEFRGETVEEFSRKYVRQVAHKLSLIERPNGDCIFWDRQSGCTVYPVRPTQCQTWPFWNVNIARPEAWERTMSVCPGSGRGRWFSLEEIEAAARRHS